MLNKLWEKTKEVASLYTGTFIVVMFLNQLLFFGLCLNPVCLVAAMPHVLFITVVFGTWINRKNSKSKSKVESSKALVDKTESGLASKKHTDAVKLHNGNTGSTVSQPSFKNVETTVPVKNVEAQSEVCAQKITETKSVLQRANPSVRIDNGKSVALTKATKTRHRDKSKTTSLKAPQKQIPESSLNRSNNSVFIKPESLDYSVPQDNPLQSQADGSFVVNIEHRLNSLLEQKENELASTVRTDVKPGLNLLVNELCPDCDGTRFNKVGKTANKIQRYICNDCGKSFQDNTTKLDRGPYTSVISQELRNNIRSRHAVNVKYLFREKLLSKAANVKSDLTKAIVVELTPVTYLTTQGRDKRKALSNTPISMPRLSIEHDIHNPHDPLAIRVFLDKVDIGFIKKQGSSVSIDKFCFNTFDLKSTLCIHWNGSQFLVQSIEDTHLPTLNPLSKFGIQSLWHMSHIDNVGSILVNGILSNSNAYGRFSPVDISNQDVQSWRARSEPSKGRPIHDYAPTYLSIRNPMLFSKKHTSSQLCILEIASLVVEQREHVFTDGNAASRDTRFYDKASDLDKLPWDVLNAEYWSDFDDGKRKKCAEVLIYPGIDKKYIKAVHCSNFTAKRIVEKNAPSSSVPVKVSPQLFF